jgi:Zn-dependent peptidase ImmA (M78 family)/transcriptional regulator with XRE-family HTH domain
MIGERIRMARRAAGLSQQALGDRAGVSKMSISKYERGEMTPGSAMLVRIADATGMRVDYFLRPITFQVSAPCYRSKSSMSARSRGVVEEKVREWLDRYVDVEALLDVSVPFPYGGAMRNIKTMDDVENAAQKLRQTWDLGDDPIPSVVGMLEDRGVKVGLVNGEIGLDALTFLIDGVSPAIAVRRDVPGDRERFSICHELGHIVLATTADLSAEKAPQRFAGAFLVPAQTARRELGERRNTLDPRELYELKHEYGMSMNAWIHRAADLGIIDRSTAVSLYKEFSKLGWRAKEPGTPVSFEAPSRLELLVLRAVSEGVIGDARAAELLGKTLREFRHWRLESWHDDAAPVCA